MSNKKNTLQGSPDLKQMQAVVIDHRTTIYIPMDADVEEARKRNEERSTQFFKNVR